MAQTIIKRTKTSEEEYVDETICELCGKRTKNERNWNAKHDHGSNGVDQVTIKHEQGYGYGDGGNIQETIVDVCPECFKTKVLPWLQSQGAKPRQDEVDW